MERIPRVFDLGFGCHPRDLSLVFTLSRATYRVWRRLWVLNRTR
jgi:hypothetical protein